MFLKCLGRLLAIEFPAGEDINVDIGLFRGDVNAYMAFSKEDKS